MKKEEVLSYIQQNLNVPKNQWNDFGKYNYRSLEDIFEALKPLLKECGANLIIYDDIVLIGDRYYVKAIGELRVGDELISAGSGLARESETKKGMDVSQISGAASSYARKYCLAGLFLCDDVKDMDALNKGDNGKPTPPPKKAPPKKPAPKPEEEEKGFFKFLKEMEFFKEELGSKTYYEILNHKGYEKSNEINKRADQISVYTEMKTILDEEGSNAE